MTGIARGDRLAIEGGTAVRSSPLPSWPHFEPDEIDAATRVLRSGRVNYWTGEEGRRFEEEFTAWTGAKHAVALANGTVALEAALTAAGIGKGDDVIVTPRSFIASASCAVSVGARPVFADVDPESQNITADTIEAVLTPKTRAIVAVHLAGWPCDMDAILALAERRSLTVIEDCAQAHGARLKGRRVGVLGHIAAWSFCQDKIITTAGEGGMVTTDDAELWARVWALKDHGKSWDAVHRRQHPPGFRWLHESFGSNWRMTEVQSAVGRVQLRKVDGWVERRRAHAARLNKALAGIEALRTTVPPADTEHAYYKYYVFVRPELLRDGWTRDRIMAAVGAEGVPCFSGSCSEVYLERAFDGTSLRPAERLPVARELGDTSLMLMVHPTLSDSDIDDAASALQRVFAAASL